MKLNKFRKFLIILFVISASLSLYASRLVERWYGQVIGDTFRVRSRLMTEFRKESTYIRAFIVLPIAASTDTDKRFPEMYHFHGFGGDYKDATYSASRTRMNMRKFPETEFVHVFLDGSLEAGYHYFVNSENTGPWGNALIQDFIPELERNYPVAASPAARFLTGHSSGGWVAMWLQVNHPELFGGVWSVSPDPLDFSDFFGINLTENSSDNFYVYKSGKGRRVARSGNLKKLSVRQYVLSEEDEDYPCNSDMGAYECAFGPRKEDGSVRRLFNRKTGEIDRLTAKAWQSFDISLVLKTKLQTSRDQLEGKINVFCGSRDDFFLEKPFLKFCELLKSSGLRSVCELVDWRGHAGVYLPTKESPNGLSYRIDSEARKLFDQEAVRTTP